MNSLETYIRTATPDAIIATGRDGTIRHWSDGARHLFGHGCQEAQGLSLFALLGMAEAERRQLADLIAAGGGRCEAVWLRKDRAPAPVGISVTVAPGGGEAGDTAIIVARERVPVESTRSLALKAALRELIAAMPDAILALEPYGRIVLANDYACRLFGYGNADLVGLRFDRLLPDRFRATALRELLAVRVATSQPDLERRRELCARCADGREIWVQVGLSTLASADGMLVVATIRDVTRDRRTERRFRLIVDAAPDPMIIVDEAGKIVLTNARAETIFGYGRAELLGQSVEMLLPQRLREDHARHRGRFAASASGRRMGGDRDILLGCRKDGSEFPVEISLSPIMTEDGRLVASTVRDASNRLRQDQLKSEFVSTVSHELRTPLTSIRGSLGLVAGGAAGVLPSKAKGLIDIAYKSSERLVGLINDILDIEKIQSGQMELHLEWLEPVQLVQQALEANHAYAAGYEVSYRLASQPSRLVRFRGDANRLIQVLNNLLSNAAKFSPAGAMVEVSIDIIDTLLRIGVRDHGQGVPESFQDKIFKRFAQAEDSHGRRRGTGLGLSIAKAIIEHHGGRIGFEQPQDGGSLFWFTLPLPATAAPAAPPQRRRVLICEDDRDVAMLLQLMIEQAGWQADVAHDGESALARAQAGGYHAITVDLRLPGMNGITLIEALRAFPGTAALPVIVIAAAGGDDRDQIVYGRLDVLDCLAKPIDHQRLLRALRGIGRPGSGHARILHVDDDADGVAVVESIIGGQGDLTHVATLAQAWAALAGDAYDLVILDLNLPDGCGLDLLATISAFRPPIPVLIFSAQDMPRPPLGGISARLVKGRADNEELRRLVAGLLKQPPEFTMPQMTPAG